MLCFAAAATAANLSFASFSTSGGPVLRDMLYDLDLRRNLVHQVSYIQLRGLSTMLCATRGGTATFAACAACVATLAAARRAMLGGMHDDLPRQLESQVPTVQLHGLW